MPDRRWKDYEWSVTTPDGKLYEQTNNAQMLAVLMDLRDQMRLVNAKLSVLQCPNFLAIPRKLERIGRNTARRKKPKAIGKPKLSVVR